VTAPISPAGLGGNDEITGGAGRDRLFGEDGADRILAQDGEFDVVGCGAGRDSVVADSSDLVGLDCERVSRR
jgi:Ca2+-binding RTX toxin-like protein